MGGPEGHGALKGLGFVVVAFFIVALPSVGLDWSSEHLPRPLHVVILVATGLFLIWGLSWISTEDLRTRSYSVISEWFGELAGPVILSTLILATAARALASFTFILYDNGLVVLSFQALAVLILIPTVGWFIRYRRAQQKGARSGTDD